MRKWAKTTGFLFLGISSVYAARALSVVPEEGASAAAEVTPAADATILAAVEDEAVPVTVKAADPKGTAQVNISDAGTIELHASDANVVELLRTLSLQSQKNIISSKEVRGAVSVNLYNVTFKEALDAILQPNGFGYREKGNFIFVYTAKEIADLEKAERKMVAEVFRVHYTPAVNASNMIKPLLSKEAEVSVSVAAATGIGSDSRDAGGNAHATEDILVVRDYPENLDQIRKALKEIDQRPQQVLVEATIVAARLNEDNALGVNFTILGGVDFNRIEGAAAVSRQGAMTGNLERGDTGLGATNYEGVGTVFPQMTNGLKVGLVYNNLAFFLNALEETTDTHVLANPKVLTLNKQRGEVLVGSEDGYLTTTVTESAAVQTVQFLETGTKLVFRPYIGSDGYIRMEVHPESSEGGVDARGLPAKRTTQVTTNVMVRDGHTVVIGGLFRERSSMNRNQVPVLGNLPLVGPLFRNQADSTVREEIIILLTPHIVKDDKGYAASSEELLKDFDRLRVGVRRGMMPWGRERLAEWNYELATRELNKPEPDQKKVQWHLNCATNLNPKFLEAIKLKESVTGKQVTSVDNATVRDFVKRQILAERTAAAPQAVPATPAVSTATPAENPVTTTDQVEAPETEACPAPETAETDPSEISGVGEAARDGFAITRNFLGSFWSNQPETPATPADDPQDEPVVVTELPVEIEDEPAEITELPVEIEDEPVEVTEMPIEIDDEPGFDFPADEPEDE